MTRYKICFFAIIFWWSLVCPPSLGFPGDVLYIDNNDSCYRTANINYPSKNYEDTECSDVKVKIRFKYLTFLNKYFD